MDGSPDDDVGDDDDGDISRRSYIFFFHFAQPIKISWWNNYARFSGKYKSID